MTYFDVTRYTLTLKRFLLLTMMFRHCAKVTFDVCCTQQIIACLHRGTDRGLFEFGLKAVSFFIFLGFCEGMYLRFLIYFLNFDPFYSHCRSVRFVLQNANIFTYNTNMLRLYEYDRNSTR